MKPRPAKPRIIIAHVEFGVTGHVMPLVVLVGTIEVPVSMWWQLKRVGLLDLREESYGLVGSALFAATAAS
jgi:hypothetical protein